MKKKIFIIIPILLISLGCMILWHKNSRERKSYQVMTEDKELLVSSTQGYNSVAVYRKENLIVINAESYSKFFDGVQFTVETQEEIKANDIDIIWSTIDGQTEKTEDNDFIIAEISIYQNDKLIVDTRIDFATKAFDESKDIK